MAGSDGAPVNCGGRRAAATSGWPAVLAARHARIEAVAGLCLAVALAAADVDAVSSVCRHSHAADNQHRDQQSQTGHLASLVCAEVPQRRCRTVICLAARAARGPSATAILTNLVP